ncbi:MAG: hypothetical protein J6W40_02690 [Alphaproteobacteria bacterium]|nr:hypothetical protein [Alphaproteobacteria bacterium]
MAKKSKLNLLGMVTALSRAIAGKINKIRSCDWCCQSRTQPNGVMQWQYCLLRKHGGM